MIAQPRLHHVRAGAGEPLLLIHGLGADHRCWNPVTVPLAQRFDVIAVDLPGFGATPPLPASDQPRPGRMAELVIALMAELAIEEAHLVGNSLGAWVALEAAARGAARSVTSLCAAGLWSKPLLQADQMPARRARRIAAMARPALLGLAGTATGRRAMLATTVRDGAAMSAADARMLMDTWLTAPGYDAANLWMRRGAFDAWDRITAPVTLAWGEKDRLVRPPRRTPPGTTTVTLAGCAHLPMWDDPGLVMDNRGWRRTRRGRYDGVAK